MVVLTALVNVANGKGEEFEKEFHKLALKVRKDPGAISVRSTPTCCKPQPVLCL